MTRACPSAELLLVLGGLLLPASCGLPPPPDPPPDGRASAGGEERPAGYAGNAVCVGCHEKETELWARSPHALHGVARAEPDGGADLAVGSQWVQAYMRRDDTGYHRVVPNCMDLGENVWRDVDEVLDAIQGPLMPEERGRRAPRDTAARSFERDCSGCHSSGPHMRFDLHAGRLESSFRGIEIDCEACHGPGAAHAAAWRRLDDGEPLRRLDRMDARAASAVCGRCHGGPAVSEDFTLDDAEHYVALPRGLNAVFSNGASAGQNYQADTFLRSACHTEGGLECTDCHDAHGPGLAHREHADALCTRCHEREAAHAHTHHAMDQDGARCVNCHMPRLLTGLTAHQRDHRIASPLPAAADAPDACTTACHVDKDRRWSSEWAAKWWGEPPAAALDAIRGVHLARSGAPRDAAPLLRQALTQNDPFLRGAAAAALGETAAIEDHPLPELRLLAVHVARDQPDGTAALRRALLDAEPVIRANAWLALRRNGKQPGPPPLADLEVAARLAREAVQLHTALAVAYVSEGRTDEAIAILERLVVFADGPDGPWLMLAGALSGAGRKEAAAGTIAIWVQRGPDEFLLQQAVDDALRGEETQLARWMLAAAEHHLPSGALQQHAGRMRRELERTAAGSGR